MKVFRCLDALGDLCEAMVSSATAMAVVIYVLSCGLMACAALSVLAGIREYDWLYAAPCLFTLFMAAVLAALARRIQREGL